MTSSEEEEVKPTPAEIFFKAFINRTVDINKRLVKRDNLLKHVNRYCAKTYLY